MWKLALKQRIIESNCGGRRFTATNINFHSNVDDHICQYFGPDTLFLFSFCKIVLNFSPCLCTSGYILVLPLKQSNASIKPSATASPTPSPPSPSRSRSPLPSSSSPQSSFWEQDPSPRWHISPGMVLHLDEKFYPVLIICACGVFTCVTNSHLNGEFAHSTAVQKFNVLECRNFLYIQSTSSCSSLLLHCSYLCKHFRSAASVLHRSP